MGGRAGRRFLVDAVLRAKEGQGDIMKRIALIAALALLACGSVSAQTAAPAPAPAAADKTCKDQATDKKLAGAALNSFMKKCSSDAQKGCAAESKGQNLKGAAATSHTKKCTDDKVGA
jgi:Skp family chaperone for outer membrane proteins